MASLPLPRFCSTTPHFFKIILEETSLHKLKIPTKFVMKYGKDLSNTACLKLPSGSEWKVELTRCKGKVWFEQGWPEFSVFCSLEYGSFLLFRYEGNSYFNVCIFDMSATEIEYPLTMPEMEKADEDDDILIEDFQPSPKTRRRSPFPCPPYKKMRTSLSGAKADMTSESENIQPCDMFEKPIENKDSHRSGLQMENLENIDVDDMPTEKDGRVIGGSSGTETFLKQTFPKVLGNAVALRRASDFKSENPSVVVSLHPSDIQSYLSLPSEFARRHLIKQHASNITLQVSDGNTWSVEFTYREEEARFQCGWLTFVKDNNLEVGDVCVFVLIKDIKLSLRVVFFRTSEAISSVLYHGKNKNSFPTKKDGGSSSSSQIFLNRTPQEALGRMKQLTAVEKANAFKFDKPSFRMTMQPSSIRYDLLDFPNEFARRYLMKLPSGISILRISDGRTWLVKFKYDHAHSRCRLLKGWSPFVRDNNLKVGDVCVFTLINSVKLLFEVAFFPRQESANSPSSTGHDRGAIVQVEKTSSPIVKIEPECNMDGEIGPSCSCEIGESGFPKERNGGSSSSSQTLLKQTHEVLARMKPLTATVKANAFTSDKPSFRITMHPYSIHYDSVSLPNEFAKRYLMELSSGTVTLQVSDGRTWSVNFKYNHAYSRAKLMKGWSLFVKDNNLKVGDVCIFTLINCMELVFDIVFFPTEDSTNCPLLTGVGRGATVQVQEMKRPQVKVEPGISLNCKVGKNKMSNISGQVTRRSSSSLRTSRNHEAASKFSSKNPFFQVTIGSSRNLHVPANFARSFIKQDKQTVMLQVKDRSWPVTVISYKPWGTSMVQGWSAFAKENCLKIGDACIFELMEMNNIVLKGHIFRC